MKSKYLTLTNGDQDYYPSVVEIGTQLNAYAYIAQRIGYAPVTRLWLLYLEPYAGRKVSAGVGELLLSFAPVLRPVALDEALVHRLLQRAWEILSLERPPLGRDGCYHCQQLERLLELLRESPPF